MLQLLQEKEGPQTQSSPFPWKHHHYLHSSGAKGIWKCISQGSCPGNTKREYTEERNEF